MEDLPEKKQARSPEEEAVATRLLSEWQQRLEEKEAALNSNIDKQTEEVGDFLNYLTNEKGWDWGELLCELEDIVRKKSPATFMAWHKLLQTYAMKNGFDAWKAKTSKEQPPQE